ncbi:MAG: hypothetical protein JWQ74_152 [Marmoricola sp.]|nr:hypothetical protein [Marmoricola sp.]
MRSTGRALLAVTCSWFLVACGSAVAPATVSPQPGQPATAAPDAGRECSADLRIAGEHYRAVNGLMLSRRGASLGSGEFLGCDGTPLPSYGSPTVHRIPGIDPVRAVLVDSEEPSTYLNKRFAFKDRPDLLKETGDFLKCSGPARFTATWNFVDVEDLPAMSDYAAAHVPYRITFSTSEGTGVGLDRWSQVTTKLLVTAGTDPVPSVAFLERALGKDEPVLVTSRCEDGEYVATSLRFAED